MAMSSPLNRIKTKLLRGFLITPFFNRYSNKWYNGLGVKGHKFRISSKEEISLFKNRSLKISL